MQAQHASAFRRCLDDLDTATARKLWAETHPHLAQPQDDYEMLVTLHNARTQSASVPADKRLYSHRWLTERGLASSLPEDMKPRPERVELRYVDSVCIGIVSEPGSFLAPIWGAVQKRMEARVAEVQADGEADPERIKALMLAARDDEIKRLVGRALE